MIDPDIKNELAAIAVELILRRCCPPKFITDWGINVDKLTQTTRNAIAEQNEKCRMETHELGIRLLRVIDKLGARS